MTQTLTLNKINFQTGETTAEPITKSQIFGVYNKARAAAKAGKLDEKRVNRALGYLLSGQAASKWAEYNTTVKFCGCPDHRKGHTCKHQIALMVYKRIEQQVTA